MLISSSNRKTEFESLVPALRERMSEWQVVSVRPPRSGAGGLLAAQDLQRVFGARGGVVLQTDDRAIMVVRYDRYDRTGRPGAIRAELEQKLPGKGYRYTVRSMTSAALAHLERAAAEPPGRSADSLFARRGARTDNRVLAIDDDNFYLSVLRKACEKQAAVYTSEDGANLLQLYSDINPDIVFLDIHLPALTGQKILEDIMGLDFDAYVIMISSDSSGQNVLHAMSSGASGFLKKPLEPQKLQLIFHTCPTFRNARDQDEAKKAQT